MRPGIGEGREEVVLMNVARLAVVVMFLACLSLLPGCGGGESGGSARAGGGGREAEKPLEGRGVSRSSELVGVWMRVSEGELLGLEFLKDEQVIVTVGRGMGQSSMTMSYRMLDGGRLSMVTGGGSTTVYRATRSGDLLELARESAGAEARAQRFKRLASGTTLAEGVRAHAAALEAERAEMVKGIAALLRGDGKVGLVLAPEGAGAKGWEMSLRIERGNVEQNRMFEGEAVLDPGNSDVLRPVTLHAIRGTVTAVDELSARVRLTIEIGPAVEPAEAGDVRGRVDLVAEGTPKKPVLTGTAQVPGRWQGQAGATLVWDATRHGAARAKLAMQRAAREAAVAEVTDAIGGRAVLRGEKRASGGGAAEPVEVTIERVNEAAPVYRATVTVGSRRDQTADGTVGLVVGRGALYVNMPWGEQWRLHVEDGGRRLTGPWRPHSRADFISHGDVLLAVERTWTMAEVEAERAAIARFMSEDLRAGKRFVGVMETIRGGDLELWPVTADLRVGENGAAEGEVWVFPERGGARMTGRVSGTGVTLSATGYMEGSRQDRSLLQLRLDVQLKGMEPRPTMRGTLRVGSVGGNVAMTLAGSGAPDATALAEAVRGRRFVLTNTSISKRPAPAYLLVDEEAPAEGGARGVLIGHDITGRTTSKLPPGVVRIEAVEDRGQGLLKITIDSCPDPVRGQESERFEFTAVVAERDGRLVVNAWDAPAIGNTTWLWMEPASEGEAVEATDEERIRLAALRMGAVTSAPRSPAQGEGVLLIVRPTERDARVGQIFYADGRYNAGNSVATAALHAGVLRVDEMGIVRLTYGAPFTAPTEVVERNGVKSAKSNFRPTNTVPTFTIERVEIPGG